MKKGYKCEHCPTFSENAEEILTHELKCSFNPINRKCYTCIYAFEDGAPISGSHTSCKKGLDTLDGMDDGNCIEWENKQDYK